MRFRHNYTIATFNGRHNEVKSKALLVMFALDKPLSLKQLALHTGCSYWSLSTLLPRWYRWGYVLAYGSPGSYRYKIAAKGRRFLHYIPVDNYEQYRADLIAVRRGRMMVQLKKRGSNSCY